MTAPQDIAITQDSAAVSGSVQRLVLPCGVTLYHGDCLEILPHLEGVDAVVSDPPYGMGYKRSGNSRNSISSTGKVWTETIEGDDAPFDPSPWVKW